MNFLHTAPQDTCFGTAAFTLTTLLCLPVPTGEWILDNTPSAVMVETACTPSHGAMPGNHIYCSDQVPGTPGFFLRM